MRLAVSKSGENKILPGRNGKINHNSPSLERKNNKSGKINSILDQFLSHKPSMRAASSLCGL